MSTPEEITAGFRKMLTHGDLRVLIARVILIEQAAAKHEAPVDTGRLRRSINARVLTATRGEVVADVLYARAVQEGTRAHVIRPRLARALFWKGARHPVRVVHHPGSKANPFFTRAIGAAQPAVDRECESWGIKLYSSVM